MSIFINTFFAVQTNNIYILEYNIKKLKYENMKIYMECELIYKIPK